MRIGDTTIITGEVASIQFSEAAGGVQLLTNNTSNTASSFSANVIKIAGNAADGPYLKLQKDVTAAWALGMDMDAFRATGENRFIIRTNYSSTVSPESGSPPFRISDDSDAGVGSGIYTTFIQSELHIASEGTGYANLVINSNNEAGVDAFILLNQKTGNDDTWIHWAGGNGSNWHLGTDGSAGSQMYLTTKSTGSWPPDSTNTMMKVEQTGEVNFPLTPAFLANGLTASPSNVTGDGTAYIVTFPTERFDQNGDFDATSTFTAPVAGRYWFASSVLMTGVGAQTSGSLQINTSNINGIGPLMDPSATNAAGTLCWNTTFFADMDAMDTAQVQLTLSGSTKTVSLQFNSVNVWFAGFLQC